MKINLKFYATLLISIFMFSAFSFAQDQSKEITFSITKKGDKFFTKNSQGQKSIDFTITGIDTQEEMKAFITKFKAIEGVLKFDVSSTSTNGSWSASATFLGRATKKYFGNVLVATGVKKIIIDGNVVNSEDLDKYSNKSNE